MPPRGRGTLFSETCVACYLSLSLDALRCNNIQFQVRNQRERGQCVNSLNIACAPFFVSRMGAMARKPRIQYPCARYHVLCRGNRKEESFRDHLDREPFLRTLEKPMGIANFGMGTRTRVYQAVRTFREGTRLEARRMGKALLNLTI